jgi:transcriptional regulator with XRE-family HTH domain
MSETFWKSQREKLGKTQLQIAIEMGRAPSLVSAWDLGKAIPGLRDSEKLAEVFKVSEKRIVEEIVAQKQQPAGAK